MPRELILRKLKPCFIVLALGYFLMTPLSAAWIASLLLQDFSGTDKNTVLFWSFVALVTIPWILGLFIVAWLRFFRRSHMTKRYLSLREKRNTGRATSINLR